MLRATGVLWPDKCPPIYGKANVKPAFIGGGDTDPCVGTLGTQICGRPSSQADGWLPDGEVANGRIGDWRLAEERFGRLRSYSLSAEDMEVIKSVSHHPSTQINPSTFFPHKFPSHNSREAATQNQSTYLHLGREPFLPITQVALGQPPTSHRLAAVLDQLRPSILRRNSACHHDGRRAAGCS